MKIGLWNTAFLGDAILTLPLIHTLARGIPGAEIHFFVRKGLEPLFSSHPDLAAVHGFDKRGKEKGLMGAYAQGRRLAREGFDLWISAHTSFRSGLISRWSSAAKRIGYNRPWFNSFFYTHTVDRRFTSLEEIERLLQLAAPLSLEPVLQPQLTLPQEAIDHAKTVFAPFEGQKILGLHPGSTWPTKQWPPEYFSQVLSMAVTAGLGVAVFAGPGEEAMAQSVIAQAKLGDRQDQVLDLSGALTLPRLAACIDRVDAYLTGDSGPMHLAWVQGTPVTAVFGPTVRKLGFFPRGKDSMVLELDMECRPCSLHGPVQCPLGHHGCMQNISPAMAFESIARQLELTS